MSFLDLLKKIFIIPLASLIYTVNIVVGYIVINGFKLLIPVPYIKKRLVLLEKTEWLHLTVAYGCIFFPHPIYVAYKKQVLMRKRCLVVSNHISNYDWLMVLIVLQKLNMYDDVRILIKDQLSSLPIFGRAMSSFGYIFVKRNWKQDSTILKDALKFLQKEKQFFFLIFPEGTILVPDQHKKCLDYSEKMDLRFKREKVMPQNTLIPRLTGPNMILNELKEDLDGYVDVTAFIRPYCPYPQRSFEYSDVYFKNTGQIAFFFLLDFIENVKSQDWLYEIFDRKEKLLEKYKNCHDSFIKIENKKDFEEKIKKINNEDYEIVQITLFRWRNFLHLFLFLVIMTIFAKTLKLMFN